MRITKKRINNPKKYLSHLTINSEFIVGIPVTDNQKKINDLWIIDWETYLLSAKLWKANYYNTEWKVIVRKDLPKEVYSYEVNRGPLTDRGGKVHYWTADVSRERYQRELVPPFEVYVRIWEVSGRKCLIAETSFLNKTSAYPIIKNTINMFLETFWECYIMSEWYNFYEIEKVNWRFLPQWEYPRDKVKEHIKSNLRNYSWKRAIYIDRLDYLNSFSPDFTAIWVWGFDWYFVVWFQELWLYIAENTYYGNATYILDSNRKEISQLSKWEILSWKLSIDRIIHIKSRKRRIKELIDKHRSSKNK